MIAKWMTKALYPFVFGYLFFVLLFTSCLTGKESESPAIDAVPPSSPMFLKINDAVRLKQILGEQNEWWKLLGKIERVKPLQNGITFVDSVTNANPGFKKFIEGKEIVLSLNPNSVDGSNDLVVIPIRMNGEQSFAEDFIAEMVKNRHLLTKKRKYNKVLLYELTSSKKLDYNFAYSFYRGLLFFSPNVILVEEAIKQLDSGSRGKDPEFSALLKTINNQAEINIFINHQAGEDIFSTYFSDQLKKKTSMLKYYSGWTELDATLKEDKILISGFSTGNTQNSYFANILLQQQPGISKIETVLPSSVDFFSSFYLSDIERFFRDYHGYINGLNLFAKNEKQLKEIENKTGVNLTNLFVEIFDKEIAESGISFGSSMKNSAKVWIMKTKSGSFTLKKIKDFQETYSSGKTTEEMVKDFKIDNQTNILCYKFPVENLPELLFGNLFGDMKASWFTVYDNYLIFSESYKTLGKVVLSNVLGETLSANSDYIKFQSGLTSKNNYYFFCNSAIAYPEANLFFNSDISNDIVSNSDFGKFRYIAWQVSSSGNMIYNNACVYYNPNLEVKSKTVWQSHLYSTISKRPLIVENRYDAQDNEIILTDSKNNVYMLNNIGRIVWQINVGSPILGDIQLIDKEKDEKYQLLFNTKEKLFIVDRKGKNVENYPVSFSVNATNGVSVFDYDKNKNYRFFVACEDQQIYAYDSDGKILEGWQLSKTDHVINQPIQHFSIEGKDYIVASDLMKDYIFDRKGNIRVQTDVVYQHSMNNTLFLEKRTSTHEPRLVTTDSKGNIHRTYFDGSHDTLGVTELNDSHFFIVSNIDEDVESEYIFTQGNQVVVRKNNGQILFNQLIDGEISFKPSVFRFSSKEKKIGVSCAATNKIFLLNSDGTLYSGFPLDGYSEFTIGFIGDDTSTFNLLVGSPDGYLYNYMVK